MPIAPATRPETYAELLARSFRLYCQVLRNTFIFGLLVAVILFIPRLICVAIGKNVFLTAVTTSQLLLFIAMYTSALWFLAAILWCVNCIERNKHENFIIDVEMAGKRILYVLGAAILLSFIGIFSGIASYIVYSIFEYLNLYSYDRYLTDFLFFLVLFTQAGISVFIAIIFYFYFPLIVVENDGILLALKQSARLVWKNIGATCCLQATPWLAYLITLIIIKIVFKVNIHIYFMPIDPVSTFYPTVMHIIILALFIPWSSSMTLVQLRDLELRKAARRRKNDHKK